MLKRSLRFLYFILFMIRGKGVKYRLMMMIVIIIVNSRTKMINVSRCVLVSDVSML